MVDYPSSVIERFWSKVEKTGACWLWKAATNTDGYGRFHPTSKKGVMAHRFAYELLKGEIPSGLVSDHLCRVRNCVNPDHIEVVTNRENVLRGEGITANNAIKTHCKRGHEFTSDNTLARYDGYRGCRTCTVAWEKERTKRRRLQNAIA